jgi:hypothetical protein
MNPWAARGVRAQGKNARRTEYGGRSYPSKAEAGYAERLDWKLRAGEIRSWKPQPNLRVTVNGIHCFWFRPDFEVYHLDGRLEYVEIKGWVRSGDAWHVRRRVFEAAYVYPRRETTTYTVLNGKYLPWEMPAKKKRPAPSSRPGTVSVEVVRGQHRPPF